MNAPGLLRLLACQIDVPEAMRRAAERDAHLARCTALVSAELARAPADLVVLPELSSIAYGAQSFARLDALAEPPDGASFQAWSAVARAHGVHVVFGFARHEAGRFFISTAVVAPDGSCLGVYDKLHLCQYGAGVEKDFFTPGEHLLTFTVGGITCAPIICYDIRIPELARTLALRHGAQLIVHCGAYFRDESFATWHDFAATRALENQVFVLSLNRAGRDYGNSVFCRPWMDETRPKLLFDARCEELRRFTVSGDEIAQARARYSFLADRRADYDALPCR